MDQLLIDVCTALQNLSNRILSLNTDLRSIIEINGGAWNYPPLTRIDFACMALNLVDKIKERKIDVIDDKLKDSIKNIPKRIDLVISYSLPQLFNGGNSLPASNQITLLFLWITNTLEPLFQWDVLEEEAFPHQLVVKLRSANATLNEIVPERDKLQSQIKLIQEATKTAQSLPADLESLQEARNKIDKFSTDSAALFGKIDTFYKNINKLSEEILEKKNQTDKLVAQCEEAYKITTTKGLAGAFDQRAIRLNWTMWIWVIGLFISLGAGVWIGATRFETISKSLEVANPRWGVIWMDLVLSIFGLAAPIWFAWLATKQIGQRFRLAEDYAYKASVAKSYEGYRKEAARIDEAFEARLFSSVLTRLDEEPLRLIEADHHGSPWHEFFNSKGFQKGIETIPELKNDFIALAKKGIGSLKSNGKISSETKIDE